MFVIGVQRISIDAIRAGTGGCGPLSVTCTAQHARPTIFETPILELRVVVFYHSNGMVRILPVCADVNLKRTPAFSSTKHNSPQSQ